MIFPSDKLLELLNDRDEGTSGGSSSVGHPGLRALRISLESPQGGSYAIYSLHLPPWASLIQPQQTANGSRSDPWSSPVSHLRCTPPNRPTSLFSRFPATGGGSRLSNRRSRSLGTSQWISTRISRIRLRRTGILKRDYL